MPDTTEQITIGPIYKHPDDKPIIVWDFVPDMIEANDTISSLTSVTSVEKAGITDDNAGEITIANPVLLAVDFIIGSPPITIPGRMAIQFRIDGGDHGENYIVQVVLVTTGGSTITRNLQVNVSNI
jgi:hypothetical protein